MLTGSGVTLDALVRCAARAGYQQAAVVGVPASDDSIRVGGLDNDAMWPLRFEQGELDFPVPGMSDVMPYRSTRFSHMSSVQLDHYRTAWRRHLARVVAEFRPQLVHCHHVWILSSLIKDVAPDVPVVTHCHATGLRQMSLCPHLAVEVRRGCARNDRFVVLHRDHQTELARAISTSRQRVRVVGAGYRSDLFSLRGRETGRTIDVERGASDRSADRKEFNGGIHIAYAGKLSHAKGLPWLLDAFEQLVRDDRSRGLHRSLTLHVAGSGSGDQADQLRTRMRAMGEHVIEHGHLDQNRLAALLSRTHVFVLPSLYEGLPLVLVEALACGNRLVATRLPGIESEIAPHVGDWLELVEPPRMHRVDRPAAEDLPSFVDSLAGALYRAAAHTSDTSRTPPFQDPDRLGAVLAAFTWQAVFSRVNTVWRELLTR
ncbi:MAG: glycosyltransferase family 4 protein [Proteobacteria bacterium]|nr:glycosyltransferase family 4 protein [Pseudomonadota bacterium]